MDPYRRYCSGPDPSLGEEPYPPETLDDLDYGPEVTDEILGLFAGYGCTVIFGNRHAAPCGSWRSERIRMQREDTPRFARRVHVFQGGVVDPSQGLGVSDVEHFAGRYLGYVSLRPVSGQEHPDGYPHVAVAYLSPPRHMLRPRYHVILGVCGPADGVLPFRCAPYCRPAGETTFEAACVHGAVYQALLLKMYSYGCVPLSSQDMVAILWKMAGARSPAEGAHAPVWRTLHTMANRGVSLKDAEAVLSHPDVRAGAKVEVFSALTVSGDPNGIRREAHRCMTDYLASGLPLILEVSRRKNRKPDHAVFVIGMHLLRDPEEVAWEAPPQPGVRTLEGMELPGRFVIHDIERGPYQEDTANELFDKAWVNLATPGTPPDHGISFLAVGPRGLRLGFREARARALDYWKERFLEVWPRYERAFQISTRDSPRDTPRLVTRLLRTDQVLRRYASVVRLRSAQQRAQSDDRPEPEQLDQQAAARNVLETSLAGTDLASQWWISVEVRAAHIIEMATSAGGAVPPALVCLWRIQDLDAEAWEQGRYDAQYPRVRIEFDRITRQPDHYQALIATNLRTPEEGEFPPYDPDRPEAAAGSARYAWDFRYA